MSKDSKLQIYWYLFLLALIVIGMGSYIYAKDCAWGGLYTSFENCEFWTYGFFGGFSLWVSASISLVISIIINSLMRHQSKSNKSLRKIPPLAPSVIVFLIVSIVIFSLFFLRLFDYIAY